MENEGCRMEELLYGLRTHLNCSLGCSNFLWICAGGQTLSQSPSLASSPDYREEKQKQKKRRRKRRRWKRRRGRGEGDGEGTV